MTLRLLVFALLFAGSVAHAQNVVILEFADDRNGQLREQVEDAVNEGGKVTAIPLSRFKEAAAKKRFRGARVMSPEAVAAVAGTLQLSAAVTGIVGEKIAIVILDPAGAELWSKELKEVKGKLSEDNARRLAAAIAAAARTVAPPAAEDGTATSTGTGEETADAGDSDRRDGDEGEDAKTGDEMKGLDLSGESGTGADETAADDDRRVAATDDDEPEDRDADGRRARRKAKPGKPPLAVLHVQGATTWRSYCARPGVSSCAEYDRLAAQDPTTVPPGNPIDFSTQLPYLGFLVTGHVFPLAGLGNALNGLGLVGSFGMGFSRTDIYNISGGTRVKVGTVISTERAYTAALAYRYFLNFGDTSGAPAYAGLRVGMGGNSFEVGSTASSPNVPHTHRLYPALNLDASFPLAKYARIEGSGGLFLNTRVSPEDFRKFGAAASGTGWGAELGVAGDLVGPLGYEVRLRMTQFHDRFLQAGSEWNEGGAATETFMAFFWGVSGRI